MSHRHFLHALSASALIAAAPRENQGQATVSQGKLLRKHKDRSMSCWVGHRLAVGCAEDLEKVFAARGRVVFLLFGCAPVSEGY
jgi:hypothetical protein